MASSAFRCLGTDRDCFRMVEQSKLLKQAKRLRAMIHDWTPKRKRSVHALRVLADELMEHHYNVQIAKVAGTSASVAGTVVAGVGFGLSFFTFGASLLLSAVGLGVGAAGGATSAGTMIVEACIQKDTFKTAQKIIDDDREATEAIEELLKEVETKAQKIIIENGIKAGLAGAFVVKNCVETGLKLGARIASIAANEGGEALFRGLSVAGKVVHIGGFAFSAVLLPVDLYTLVTSSMEIDAARKGKMDNEPDAVKKLREMADDLEKNMPDENAFARELDALINALSTEIEMQSM